MGGCVYDSEPGVKVHSVAIDTVAMGLGKPRQ
jgi:hypothetical protein